MKKAAIRLPRLCAALAVCAAFALGMSACSNSSDNSARSTNPDANATQWNDGANQYASDMPTSDKIFLLSEREATKSEYGFEAWDAYKGDGTNAKCERIRVTTDYAKATGAYQDLTEGMGGRWWLRSPSYSSDCDARAVHYNGNAYSYGHRVRNSDGVGVAPALRVGN